MIGSTVASYSGVPKFSSHSRGWLLCQRFFVVFLSPYKQVLGLYLCNILLHFTYPFLFAVSPSLPNLSCAPTFTWPLMVVIWREEVTHVLAIVKYTSFLAFKFNCVVWLQNWFLVSGLPFLCSVGEIYKFVLLVPLPYLQ
jgi:hypothetical protein